MVSVGIEELDRDLTAGPSAALVGDLRTVLHEMLRACGYDVHVLSVPSNRWIARIAGSVDVPEQTLFYMNTGCRYDNQRFVKKLPKFEFPLFQSYSGRLFAYALENLVRGGKP